MYVKEFQYDLAFSRNLGFVSRDEQKIISQKKVAIPGMGGVGGHHLHSLARLGFKNFHIADFDSFDIHNFNRQIGAKMSTVGKSKAEVMEMLIRDIIPDANIKIFSKGVTNENREEFLEGIDYVVDGLDVYVIKERISLFDLAHRKGIPVLTAGPIGMGTCVLCFSPNGMRFSEYFNINLDMSDLELLVHFLAGVSPRPFFVKYLKYKNEVDLIHGKTPSLHTGVLAATSAISAEIFKLALSRGRVKYAPSSTQYDFYLGRIKNNWLPFGNRHPKQRMLIYLLKKHYTR